MGHAHDGYRTSLVPSRADSDIGTRRKVLAALARLIQPNSIADVSKQTAATGTNYVALPSVAAVRLVGDNGTGTSIIARRVGKTATRTFASGAVVDLPCVANASEWEIKRTDDSNTQVTLLISAYNVI